MPRREFLLSVGCVVTASALSKPTVNLVRSEKKRGADSNFVDKQGIQVGGKSIAFGSEKYHLASLNSNAFNQSFELIVDRLGGREEVKKFVEDYGFRVGLHKSAERGSFASCDYMSIDFKPEIRIPTKSLKLYRVLQVS